MRIEEKYILKKFNKNKKIKKLFIYLIIFISTKTLPTFKKIFSSS